MGDGEVTKPGVSEAVLAAPARGDALDIKTPEAQLPPGYRVVAYLHAAKATDAEISTLTGETTDEVSRILQLDLVRSLAQDVQKRQYSRDPIAHDRTLVPDSIVVTQNIMLDGREKGTTRLKAAEMIQDRALGKPMQKMDIQSSSIATLFDMLDDLNRKDRARAIEAESRRIKGEEVEEAEVLEENTRPPAPFEKWVEENL